jgi:hypothetical protein
MAHASTEYTLTVVDAYLLFDDFFARPKAYGFDPNVTHSSCLTGAYGEAPRKLCSNPDQYVFWDEYHVRMHISDLRLALTFSFSLHASPMSTWPSWRSSSSLPCTGRIRGSSCIVV